MRTLILCIALAPFNCLAAEDVLRVATFNINWANINLPDIERVIRQSNADVVCIQESTRRSEAFFKNRLTDQYGNQLFRGFRGRYKAERSGFLSKLPLADVTFVPPAGGLFGTHFATLQFFGTRIRLANVHLSPFTIRRGAGFRQALQDVSAIEATHQKEIRQLIDDTDPHVPMVLCGDFNSLSTFSAPSQLRELGFTDSFAAVTENADTHPTWRWPVGTTRIQFRIDYIFHSEHFRTKTSRIHPTTGSDHALVVSEFVWKQPRD